MRGFLGGMEDCFPDKSLMGNGLGECENLTFRSGKWVL